MLEWSSDGVTCLNPVEVTLHAYTQEGVAACRTDVYSSSIHAMTLLIILLAAEHKHTYIYDPGFADVVLEIRLE